MGNRGALLAGLLIAGTLISIVFLFVVFGLPRLTTHTNIADPNGSSTSQVGGTPDEILQQAAGVKIQAELKSLSTALATYYAEMGVYPDSLDEVASYGGGDLTNIEYLKCSDQSVVFYHNSSGYPGYVLNYGEITPTSGSSPPSCL
ncbi:MAG: hypothetical protein A2Z11_00260 [Candidatus Woykebacteria bacterium RBG_16_43_9]|uniref:Type II secretion system protein GspG C-terminal domain-containing protein n=1 Tax=Candidatus Woykebacteria bacterium RBG_16_43_9 TaxID=1802596 RepID=A0A1G1WGA2_9BACT|nr:MAG: hypothetical protein A2Z11_00260 [Candidatus Woykebacteria bacterium RBG_16_43_9]